MVSVVHVSKMVRRAVGLVLFFLACVHAAPVPDNAKISLIRNSTFGLALAAGKSKTIGILQGNRNVEEIVKDAAERRPDFSLLENVNAGGAFAIDGSISIGAIKDNIFNGRNPFSKKK